VALGYTRKIIADRFLPLLWDVGEEAGIAKQGEGKNQGGKTRITFFILSRGTAAMSTEETRKHTKATSSRKVDATRFRAVVAGGHGPDFIIGKATTRGFHQSVLSKQLNSPVKWSYRKLILWWALVFLSIGWIVFYINTGTKNSSAVLSPPLILFSGLSAITFLLLLVLFWRHNQFTHKRGYSQWERSFLCQRCGTLIYGAGIGFPQKFCKAEARCVAKVLQLAKQVGTTLVPTPTRRRVKKILSKRLRSLAAAWF
jgi:hypothetical protein